MPLRRLFAAFCFAASSSAALAQADYPSKPIRLVVGFAAGGISDVLARALAAKFSQLVGQQMIVDNKPGAGSTIAGDLIAKSAPDGYTIWLHDITSHAINASLYAKLPYDSLKDFTPITLVASTPLMLVVHPSIPANSVQELIGLLKAAPGKYSYGSSGNGTIVHLSAEMLKSAAGGLNVVHVPYKGSAPATVAILGGEVAFVFSTMPPAISSVKGGKLRALGVTTPKRSAAAPDVPTMIEAGLPGFEIVLYSGVLGPAGMNPAIVRRLNTEFARVVRDPDIQKVYESIGADPISGMPEEFRTMMAGEIAKLAPVVRASGARIDEDGVAERPLLPQHDRYGYVPLPERKDYSWPSAKRLAFCITTNIEWFAFGAGLGHDPAKTGEPQTHRNYAWRDYGNRIGVWRLFELFEELKLPAAHNCNSLLYQYAPQIMGAIRLRGDEVVAHGRSNAENLRGLWQPDEERLLREVTDTITAQEGQPPKGWMGAGAYETANTPDLLKELGYRYLMDWPMDDQPVWLRTRAGPLLSVPYPIELNDAQAVIHRKQDASQFCDMIVQQFDEMIEQCARHPLVMNVSVHPYVFGQPFRLRGLRRALKHCVEHPQRDRVWWTRPGEIADFCYQMPPGIIPGS